MLLYHYCAPFYLIFFFYLYIYINSCRTCPRSSCPSREIESDVQARGRARFFSYICVGTNPADWRIFFEIEAWRQNPSMSRCERRTIHIYRTYFVVMRECASRFSSHIPVRVYICKRKLSTINSFLARRMYTYIIVCKQRRALLLRAHIICFFPGYFREAKLTRTRLSGQLYIHA